MLSSIDEILVFYNNAMIHRWEFRLLWKCYGPAMEISASKNFNDPSMKLRWFNDENHCDLNLGHHFKLF